MSDTQIMETIHGCFEEMVVAINGRLDQMQTELKDGLHKELQKHEERFDQIDRRLDRMDERLDRMDERLDKMDERFDRMDERLDKMDERFDRMDERLDKMDERFDQIDKRLNKMDERFDGIDEHLKAHDKQLDVIDRKLTGLALHVENETDRNIRLLAENHIELVNKLNEGIDAANNNRMYAIQVGYLIKNVDKLKEEVEDLKKGSIIRRPGRRALKSPS